MAGLSGARAVLTPSRTGERASVRSCLRLGTGVTPTDQELVLARLEGLDSRLETFPAAEVELELSVKDRDTRTQKVTLECWLSGWTRLVATSQQRRLTLALSEVRDGLRRQLDDAKTRTEPRNNRKLR